jgi:hypothetical protein
VEECLNRNKDSEELTFDTSKLSNLTEDLVSTKLRIPVMLLLSENAIFVMKISAAREVERRFKAVQAERED